MGANGAQAVRHHSWGNLNFSRTAPGITKWFWVTIEGYLSYFLPKFEDFVPTGLGSGALYIHARTYTLYPVHTIGVVSHTSKRPPWRGLAFWTECDDFKSNPLSRCSFPIQSRQSLSPPLSFHLVAITGGGDGPLKRGARADRENEELKESLARSPPAVRGECPLRLRDICTE